MTRICIACGHRNGATLPEYPPVCDRCMRRQGRERLKRGDRVMSAPEIGDATIHTVERVIDEGQMTVSDKGTMYLPRALLIRVTARRR